MRYVSLAAIPIAIAGAPDCQDYFLLTFPMVIYVLVSQAYDVLCSGVLCFGVLCFGVLCLWCSMLMVFYAYGVLCFGVSSL